MIEFLYGKIFIPVFKENIMQKYLIEDLNKEQNQNSNKKYTYYNIDV